jgi:hypothetical protein
MRTPVPITAILTAPPMAIAPPRAVLRFERTRGTTAANFVRLDETSSVVPATEALLGVSSLDCGITCLRSRLLFLLRGAAHGAAR